MLSHLATRGDREVQGAAPCLIGTACPYIVYFTSSAMKTKPSTILLQRKRIQRDTDWRLAVHAH